MGISTQLMGEFSFVMRPPVLAQRFREMPLNDNRLTPALNPAKLNWSLRGSPWAAPLHQPADPPRERLTSSGYHA